MNCSQIVFLIDAGIIIIDEFTLEAWLNSRSIVNFFAPSKI